MVERRTDRQDFGFVSQTTEFNFWFGVQIKVLNCGIGNWTRVQNLRLSSQTTVLNFGLGRQTTEFNLAFRSQTTVLNFGFGNWTRVLNLRLNSPTTVPNFGLVVGLQH